MLVLLWGIGAIAAGIAVIWLGMRIVGRKSAPNVPDEPLPDTPLQQLSRRGLLLGTVLTAGLIAVVLHFGPERTFEDDTVRIGFTLLLVAIVAVFAFLTIRLMKWMRRDGGTLDERDRAILGGSHAIRAAAILITLVVWMIGLQESFWAEGAVPLAYLYLVFWSCLVVSLLALPLGVLLGYRRS